MDERRMGLQKRAMTGEEELWKRVGAVLSKQFYRVELYLQATLFPEPIWLQI